MKSALENDRGQGTLTESHWSASSRRLAWATIAVVAVFVLTLFEHSRASAFNEAENAGPTLDAAVSFSVVIAGDYSKFDHASPREHADLMARDKCESCHRRNDASVDPKFPRHKDCTGCHMVQFTAANSSASVNPICAICHRAESLNSPTAPLKNFSRLGSFTAEFDHRQHLQGIADARPPQGCAACHRPANRGVAESIPARLNAHRVCYECHSPGKQASKTSSCGTCHGLGRPSSTSTAARSYRMGFSHADHSASARLTCDRCHDVRERGLAKARQVSSIAPVQHVPNARGCVMCHNSVKSFGEQIKGSFENCKRCHKGVKFGS